MLYSRRKRLKELAEREAAGENLWTRSFDDRVRTKVLHAFADAASSGEAAEAMSVARGLILRDEGLTNLAGKRGAHEDFLAFLETAGDDTFPTCVEALYQGLMSPNYYGSSYGDPRAFEGTINTILREHRVAFELVEGEMVPFDSQELHSSVVAPTLRLLAGRRGWDGVEAAYRNALEEIGDDPADAITDVGTALQEALKRLGCEGNSLGPLAKSARDQGLLGPHDSGLVDGVKKIIDWVSADRSEKGDSHKVADVAPEDAWFAVHVVGALILRLASGPARSE